MEPTNTYTLSAVSFSSISQAIGGTRTIGHKAARPLHDQHWVKKERRKEKRKRREEKKRRKRKQKEINE